MGWAVLGRAHGWRLGFGAEGGGLRLLEGFGAGADGVEVDGVYGYHVVVRCAQGNWFYA